MQKSGPTIAVMAGMFPMPLTRVHPGAGKLEHPSAFKVDDEASIEFPVYFLFQ